MARRLARWRTWDRFRVEFYRSLTARADALFELTDALLCKDGPVRSLVDLTLVAEHRRGHGALYDALNAGRIDVDRLGVAVAGLPLPRFADGRLVLAVDVSSRLRPDAVTAPNRLFCHVYGRGRNADQFIPGWPYSMVAALEPGRKSSTQILDLCRPWERPAEPGRLTPVRVRRGFRNIHPKTTRPARAPKPTTRGPGRPPGSRNRVPATRHDVGKTTMRDKTLKARQQHPAVPLVTWRPGLEG